MKAAPESDAKRRLRLVTALETILPLCSTEDQRALRAELTPGEREGLPSSLSVGDVQVYPACTMGVVADIAAVLDWAEQYPAGDPHPLAGAFLDPAMARLYAPLKPPGLSFYDRAGHLRIKGLSAATAVAGRTQR